MKKPTRPSANQTAIKHTKRSVGGTAATASRRSRLEAVEIKNVAIATELAPAVAIAVLEKSELAPGKPPAAMAVLAAGASPSEIAGNVRLQLMFDGGAILPVEMTAAAGAALTAGLSSELSAANKSKSRR